MEEEELYALLLVCVCVRELVPYIVMIVIPGYVTDPVLLINKPHIYIYILHIQSCVVDEMDINLMLGGRLMWSER